MGYGEVESYEDFANYNEQALNLLTAKFAPVPTWIYPSLAKLLAMFDLHEWQHQHGNFISRSCRAQSVPSPQYPDR
nr:hypothetical protein [Leptolyngbya sp. 7M]